MILSTGHPCTLGEGDDRGSEKEGGRGRGIAEKLFQMEMLVEHRGVFPTIASSLSTVRYGTVWDGVNECVYLLTMLEVPLAYGEKCRLRRL